MIISIFLWITKQLYWQKKHAKKKINAYLSNRGTLHIPVEIRRICKITSEMKFNAILNIEDRRIVLSKGDCETKGYNNNNCG